MTRDRDIAAFLTGTAWEGACPTPLAGDASARRYLRVEASGRAAVIMDAPPGSGERTGPFVAVTRRLRAAGLSAPDLFAVDEAAGLLLLEDLGDALFARHLGQAPGEEAGLYEAAVDALAEIGAEPALAEGLAPYDLAAHQAEAALVTDWYLPGLLGAAVAPGVVAAYQAALTGALSALEGRRRVFVHRDYHAENLVWLPKRAGSARVGLLDYQDALAGDPAYDLVSLLEDARRDVDPALVPHLTARFADATGEAAATLDQAIATLGAQRNLKILGIFARLCRRDGKPQYLALMPRVWGHLQRDLSHPALAPLAGWVAAHLPAPSAAIRTRLAAP